MRKQRITRKALLACLCMMASMAAMAQTGSWRTYMAYYEPQQIVKLGNLLYVRASNGLYSYNLNDQSITTFDKMKQLSDTYITTIMLNRETKKLLVVYQNQNLDIIDSEGEVENISALYLKSMTGDKTINSITMQERYAYLACGFGVVKLNMRKNEITESYILNRNITAVGLSADSIYAKTDDGTICAALTANLLDPAKWTPSTAAPDDIFTPQKDDWDEYQELVSTLKPGGPKYNYFQSMRFKHDRLYTCAGGRLITVDLNRPGTVQVLDENKDWVVMQDNLKEVTGWDYLDVESVEADPADPNHVFACGRTGLYEFQDGLFKQALTYENTPLECYHAGGSKDWTLVYSLCYDNSGNLWVVNGQASNGLFMMKSNGEWETHNQDEFMYEGWSYERLRGLFVDSRGYVWFYNDHWNDPCFFCYDPSRKRVLNVFRTLTNQDGMTYSNYTPTAIAEDLDGNIWLATTIGPFVVERDKIDTANPNVTQVKVPRNDGTDLADYLLASAHINSMIIDGGGRKWFGTLDDGLYLISADNESELEHFTTDNSPILSNTVNSLAINNATGEMFIGTDVGLCSYMSDATATSVDMNKDDVYAFPNPVTPGYEGLITVRGLTLDADVKILSTSGKLIAQGRSNGGTFTWDGRDSHGRRVASGVYMVATAKNDGSKGTVCKIAIIQ